MRPISRRVRKAFLLASLVVGLLALGPVSAQAAIEHVCPSGCAFTSINAAVNDPGTNNGDTIAVDPGVYTETVQVTKDVTIQGAQHGVDARTGRTDPTQESVLNSSDGGFNVTAAGATIDGFTVQDADSAVSSIGAGIATAYSNGGNYTIVNNILTNNPIGLYLNSDATNGSSLVKHNRFVGNNQGTSASGNGIYADQGTYSVDIVENKFANQENDSILLIYGGTVSISNNTLENDATILPAFISGLTVVRNSISNSRFHGIELYEDSSIAPVTRNKVNGSQWSALRVIGGGVATVQTNSFRGSGDYGVKTDNGTIAVHNNNIVNNVTGELYNDDTAHQLNAENNYYGCKPLPTCIRTTDGAGTVDFTPWLTKSVQVK